MASVFRCSVLGLVLWFGWVLSSHAAVCVYSKPAFVTIGGVPYPVTDGSRSPLTLSLLHVESSGDLASCPLVALSSSDYQLYRTLTEPYDYVRAGAIYSFFFCFVVGLWWVSRSAGTILDFIRDL